ncbi:MAG TPA: acetoacetate decarboxylase family protein [Acidimicrobiales bacterium]|nr:acetoacetate decarboxylase family protein [Acidimicrobiales bacterium]
MLTGTAHLDQLAILAPTMASLDGEAVRFEAVEVLQAAFETSFAHRQDTLPPGLHPTTPPLLVLLAWKVPDGPLGPFAMVQARISCRSGVRPRGFVAAGVIDNEKAGAVLSSRFGLPAQPGTVRLVRQYDRVELAVAVNGRSALHLTGLDPDPLSAGDVQLSVTATLATTPRGLRLVQVEPEYELHRVERVRPRLLDFDAAAWGQPRLEPRQPVAGIVAVGAMTIPRLRYVSRPDVSAFEGTEKL